MISTNDNRWRNSQRRTVTSRTCKTIYEISVEGRGEDTQDLLQAYRGNGRSGSMLGAISISSNVIAPESVGSRRNTQPSVMCLRVRTFWCLRLLTASRSRQAG